MVRLTPFITYQEFLSSTNTTYKIRNPFHNRTNQFKITINNDSTSCYSFPGIIYVNMINVEYLFDAFHQCGQYKQPFTIKQREV